MRRGIVKESMITCMKRQDWSDDRWGKKEYQRWVFGFLGLKIQRMMVGWNDWRKIGVLEKNYGDEWRAVEGQYWRGLVITPGLEEEL